MFALLVRFDLPTPQSATAFDELVRAAVPDILASEAGTVVYTAHALLETPTARMFYEVYRDRQAHAMHESRPATARFLTQVRDLRPTIRVEEAIPLTFPDPAPDAAVPGHAT